MRLTRRNALIGLGTAAAGAGVIGGSGAFTSVEAERNVNVSTAGDASAALTLESTDSTNANEYVSTTSDGTIQLDLNGTSSGNGSSGLNKNAKTIIDDLVKITNNGSQDLTELNVEITNDAENDISGIFKFTKGESGGTPLGNNVDLSDGGLSSGSSVVFGLIIDLLNNNAGDDGDPVSDLPSGGYTLNITANTS